MGRLYMGLFLPLVEYRKQKPKMSQTNVQLQPGAGPPKHDGNGSRDSSEFEFVMKNSQAAPNPLLMTSNQPTLMPTPSIVNLPTTHNPWRPSHPYPSPPPCPLTWTRQKCPPS